MRVESPPIHGNFYSNDFNDTRSDFFITTRFFTLFAIKERRNSNIFIRTEIQFQRNKKVSIEIVEILFRWMIQISGIEDGREGKPRVNSTWRPSEWGGSRRAYRGEERRGKSEG